jgi:hypothetical protein
MTDLHPETISEIRAHHPDLDDLPDEAIAQLSLAQFVSLRLHARDLGRVIEKNGAREWQQIKKALRR